MTAFPSDPVNARRSLAQDAIVVLWELAYGHLVGSTATDPAYILRFVDATAGNGQEIALNGVTYAPLSIDFEGASRQTTGPQGRPTIRIAQAVLGTLHTLLASVDDLKGAFLTRRRIYARNLDGGDDPDPSAVWWPYEKWVIHQKQQQQGPLITWELTIRSDVENVELPLGRIEHNYCPFVYGPDRTAEDKPLCTWDRTGGPFFDANDNSVMTEGEDGCGFRYDSCALRFGARGLPLDFGGFLGARRLV